MLRLMTFDRSLQIEGIDRGRYGFLRPGDPVFYQGFGGQKRGGIVFELGKQAVESEVLGSVDLVYSHGALETKAVSPGEAQNK
jgi:hypothetical protein